MSKEENIPLTPPNVSEMAKATGLSLLPDKSLHLYEKTYAEFTSWCEKKNISDYSEPVLLAYFKGIAEKGLLASLWPKYSMLKATLNVKNNIDISRYHKLVMFIKKQKVGYTPKKSKVLAKEHVKEFISNAPDSIYLMSKVALIFGVAGAMRKDELYRLQRNDVEDMGTKFLVTVISSRTRSKRIFTVVDNEEHTLLNLIKRYISLRPAHTPHEKFFIFYRNSKCSVQPVGINTFYRLPSMIAEFLRLEYPHQYTGHCFRRTSASILSDSKADSSAIKSIGGSKSTSVTEGYVENSMENKIETAENILCNNNCSGVFNTSASTSSTHSSSDTVGDQAKSLWLKLRASYRDARRRHQKGLKSGASPHNVKPWRFQNQMSFLEPFMSNGVQEKYTLEGGDAIDDSYLQPETSNNEESDSKAVEFVNCKNEENLSENSLDGESFNVNEDTVDNESGKRKEVSPPPVTISNQPKKKKKFDNDIQSLIAHSIQMREERARQRAEERRKLLEEKRLEEDPLHSFFMSMYLITKNLPPHYQHSIKSEIFKVVSDAEAKVIDVSSHPTFHQDSSSGSVGPTSPFSINEEFQVKTEPFGSENVDLM